MSTEKQPTIVSVVTRGVSDDSNSVAIDNNSVFLKFAKSGPAIFLYMSKDAKKWNIIRAFNLGPEQELKNLQIGFSSQSPRGAGTTAIFSDITYKPEPVANLFVGE
jgi:regulation of enolase protein 1 (concanavalin A-like superfamily)